MHKTNAESWMYEVPQSSFGLNGSRGRGYRRLWTEYGTRQYRPQAVVHLLLFRAPAFGRLK